MALWFDFFMVLSWYFDFILDTVFQLYSSHCVSTFSSKCMIKTIYLMLIQRDPRYALPFCFLICGCLWFKLVFYGLWLRFLIAFSALVSFLTFSNFLLRFPDWCCIFCFISVFFLVGPWFTGVFSDHRDFCIVIMFSCCVLWFVVVICPSWPPYNTLSSLLKEWEKQMEMKP